MVAGSKEIRVVFERSPELAICFHEREGQVELGSRAFSGDGLQGEPRQLETAQRGILEHQHDLEERSMAGVAFDFEYFHQLFEGDILVA